MTDSTKSLLSEQELAILDLLDEATNKFYRLHEHHRTDWDEWTIEIHALQQRIMCRAAIRNMPERFTPMLPNHRITKQAEIKKL